MIKRDILVVGASAGGVVALPKLLGTLPKDLPAAVFVTLHVTPYAPSSLPQIIQRHGSLVARHATQGTRIQPGHVYVAPPDFHLLLERDHIRLSHGPKENRHRPAIDPMFRSAAQNYGQRVIGVVLTGNLDDGAAGLREIQDHGGLTVVQDPSEAAFPDMPRNALASLAVDFCLPLAQIGELLQRQAGLPVHGGKMKKQPTGSKKTSRSQKQLATVPKNGKLTVVTCPECHGPLWETQDGKLARFQCLVGHRYNGESLLMAHAEELEQALWVALRILEERINLQHRLAGKSLTVASTEARKMFLARARENEQHARLLRRILDELGDG